MRCPLCTGSALLTTLFALTACSTLPEPAAPEARKADAEAKDTKETKEGARPEDKGEPKKARSAAECPSVGEPQGAAGPPSKGEARHDEIRASMTRHRPKFRCCYDIARQQNPALKGQYHLTVVLKPDGTIKQITPKHDTSEIKDAGMDQCATEVAKAMVFSPNADGKETTIPYQFGFTPDGGK